MSRFDYEVFTNSETPNLVYLGANKKKYTKKQALDIAVVELELTLDRLEVVNGIVYHGFGMVDDEKYNGWWLNFIDDEPVDNKSIKLSVWAVRERNDEK